jgi:hypothetical protein
MWQVQREAVATELPADPHEAVQRERMRDATGRPDLTAHVLQKWVVVFGATRGQVGFIASAELVETCLGHGHAHRALDPV